MGKRGRKEQPNYKWDQTAQVILLSFSVEVGAITSFFVVMWRVEKIEAVVTLVRDNLAISLAGGCAFYVTLLILMKWVVEGFTNHTQR